MLFSIQDIVWLQIHRKTEKNARNWVSAAKRLTISGNCHPAAASRSSFSVAERKSYSSFKQQIAHLINTYAYMLEQSQLQQVTSNIFGVVE